MKHGVTNYFSLSDMTSFVRARLRDILEKFRDEHQIQRKSTRRLVAVKRSLDPAGIRAKISKGRMVDPRLESNVVAVQHMIRSVARKIWVPVVEQLCVQIPGLSLELKESVLCDHF